jgi:ketosteroid isomerase-like protein
MSLDRADGEALFGLLEDPGTAAAFFDRVADDVNWTVMGTHPLAGTYTSKAAFTHAAMVAYTVDRNERRATRTEVLRNG